MGKALKYGAGLIALYLLVDYSTGTGDLLKGGFGGAATLVSALQGRKS